MNFERSRDRQRKRREFRVRRNVRGTPERPRLTVFRSHKHVACQVIDDSNGKTLSSASTHDSDTQIKYGGNKEAAAQIGKLIAERTLAAGFDSVRFDRGRFKYHGRVAALADAAREAGLKF